MWVRRVLVVIACAALATCSLDFESFTFDNTLPPAGTTTTSTGVGGQGGVAFMQCETAAECPGQDTTCQTRTCTAGQCGNQNAQAGTACTEDGGQMCNGLGQCVACLTNDDCPTGQECQSGQCVGFSCMDMQENGDETDIDCGGSCPGCDNGEKCIDFGDCLSGFCDSALLCAPCTGLADCQTGNYCSNMACTPQKADGQTCTLVDECLSGNCVDGVCCDTACGAVCEACTMALSGGADGTCTPIPLTQDPQMECTDPAYCQGNGTCGTCLLATPPVGGTCPTICDGGCANDVCTINCTGSECENTTLTCPAGFACQVNCSGTQSCQNTNINCPADHQCDVACTGSQGCRFADLFCSAQGPCEVSCNSANQVCSGLLVHCGSNGCAATCNGTATFPTMQCGGSCLCDPC